MDVWSLVVVSIFLARREPIEDRKAPADGRKRTVLVCIALQFQVGHLPQNAG